MRIIWLICLCVAINGHLRASDVDEETSYFLYGEKTFEQFEGLSDPKGKINLSNGHFVFDEQNRMHRYFDHLTIPILSELDHFLFEELFIGLQCSNSLFQKHYTYIRYLYRLISLSFLNEVFKQYAQVAKNLKWIESSCIRSTQDILRQCKPYDREMKKFVIRALRSFEESKQKTLFSSGENLFSGKKIQQFQDLIDMRTAQQNHLSDYPFPRGIFFDRSKSFCDDHVDLCQSKEEGEWKKNMDQMCRQDQQIFLTLCSDQDEFYGMSFIPFLTTVIEKSHTFDSINKEGKGKECLERFVDFYRHKERKMFFLASLFKEVSYQIGHKEKQRYDQGELFVSGALREFDEKGLENFLFGSGTLMTPAPALKVATAPPIKKKLIVIVQPSPSPTIIPTTIPTIIPTPTPAPPTLVVVATAIPTPALSAFKKALWEREENKDLKEVMMDMEQLQNDFQLTEEKRKMLSEAMPVFYSRKGLSDMKRYDHLGSKKSPMSLLFIKYLVEEKHHQGLYNIQAIIGNRFYLKNDIEKTTDIAFSEIFFDEENSKAWKIKIIDEPEDIKKSESTLSKDSHKDGSYLVK